MIATVFFDFDACDYTNLIQTSIQSFVFTDELESIVDKHLDPMLEKVAIFPVTFTDNMKSSIASVAEAKVEIVKTKIVDHLTDLSAACERRLLGNTEVQQDGSQRMLQGLLLFSDFARSIEFLDGVVSSSHVLHHMLALWSLIVLTFSFMSYPTDCNGWTLSEP